MILSALLLKGNPIKEWIQAALFYRSDDLLGVAVATHLRQMTLEQWT